MQASKEKSAIVRLTSSPFRIPVEQRSARIARSRSPWAVRGPGSLEQARPAHVGTPVLPRAPRELVAHPPRDLLRPLQQGPPEPSPRGSGHLGGPRRGTAGWWSCTARCPHIHSAQLREGERSSCTPVRRNPCTAPSRRARASSAWAPLRRLRSMSGSSGPGRGSSVRRHTCPP
jgi:hypothetical protein